MEKKSLALDDDAWKKKSLALESKPIATSRDQKKCVTVIPMGKYGHRPAGADHPKTVLACSPNRQNLNWV